jgi:hypothetical protein
MLASLYRPDGDIAVTRWPSDSRHLTVKIDWVAVDTGRGQPGATAIRRQPHIIQRGRAKSAEFNPEQTGPGAARHRPGRHP